jgi:hypothetical protein
MVAKLIRHRATTTPHYRTIPFAVLSPGGQSGNFWIHPRIAYCFCSFWTFLKPFFWILVTLFRDLCLSINIIRRSWIFKYQFNIEIQLFFNAEVNFSIEMNALVLCMVWVDGYLTTWKTPKDKQELNDTMECLIDLKMADLAQFLPLSWTTKYSSTYLKQNSR